MRKTHRKKIQVKTENKHIKSTDFYEQSRNLYAVNVYQFQWSVMDE